LNKFANDVRYPHKYQTTEGDVNFSISTAQKIKSFRPLKDIGKINEK